jgi:pimeloyl-ACP methyl ester carboxylesterase
LVLCTAGLAGACVGPDKAELLARVRALPKNEVLAQVPLSQRTLPAAEETAPPETLTWLRLPRPDAPRVVLVHGTPGTLSFWSRTILGSTGADGLEADFDVTAIELPGHGVHPDPGVPEGFAALADHLARALRALDLGPVILVGHSYGGEVAWRAALDHPELVASLVLVDSSGLPRADHEWLPEELAMRENPLAGWGWLLSSQERVRTALAPHFRGEIPDGTLEEFTLASSNAANWRTMVALARDENGTRAGELGRLDVPTLLVWGAADVAYPVERFARRFLDAIPDAELVIVEDGGHYIPEEDPQLFVDLLRERFGSPEGQADGMRAPR